MKNVSINFVPKLSVCFVCTLNVSHSMILLHFCTALFFIVMTRDSSPFFYFYDQMDEVLAAVAETIKNFAVIYLVDITEVPDFNTMYELYDPSTVMFFFRNKHIMIDLGTGNNNKINWALKDKQEFVDIVETVYRGARKGRGLVIAPKDYSTKYRY